MNNGYFPRAWKETLIIPIAKTKAARDISKFRPISLLSNIGKLFERILSDHLNSFTEAANIIPNNQFGFKKGCSTEHALLVIQNKVIENLKNKKCTVSLNIDLEKAFDSIWHDGLIFKLLDLKYPDWLIKMICSFLTGRTTSVLIKTEKSEPFSILSGVPQGSILGPFLFNVYLQDFPLSDPITEEPGSIHYADDTTILASDPRPSVALEKVNQKLPHVENYFKKWRLKINTNKCELICFRNSSGKGHYLAVKESKELSLKINENPIALRSETKYLGLHFSNRFVFNKHARTVLNRAKMVSAMLKPLLSSKHVLSTTKTLIYKTLIRPILLYGFPIWFTISPSVAKEMETFERKVLRFCCGKFRKPDKKYYSNKFLYETTKITPLMVYQIELLFKKMERLSSHPNPLVRSLSDPHTNMCLNNNYYLSPFNLLNEQYILQLGPDTNRTLSVSFYEKASALNFRG